MSALGEIGTKKAGQALVKLAAGRKPMPKPESRSLADAILACAERLHGEGERAESKRLLAALAKTDQPQYIRDAAVRPSQRDL